MPRSGLNVSALALLSTACASVGAPPPAAVARLAREAASYSGTLKVRLRGPELRARSRVLVAFRRPASLRVEVPGPAGARLLLVTRNDRLTAVFPGERAVFAGGTTAGEIEALLGVGLAPAELMDLLLGVPSPRLRSYRARWGARLPRRIEAVLPDGARLDVDVEDAEPGAPLSAAAFEEPAHPGYRTVDAAEARRLWSR